MRKEANNEPLLALIPARGGSKRIHRKNIKKFIGRPIISYSIEAAREARIFSEIMVSTDDIEIAEVAKKEGAKIPFMRNPRLANDTTGLSEVIRDVILDYIERGIIFKFICCLLPTSPLIRTQDIVKAYEVLKKNRFNSVIPVVEYSYPIQRALKIENQKISMVLPENYSIRSQDLNKRYHDAGSFYWIDTEKFLRDGLIFSSNSGCIIIKDYYAQDIDTVSDWRMAELKYNFMNSEGEDRDV